MLEELDIRNFALIDSAHVDFEKGFTVLSGETGAGKSILIGSLAFLLGGKASLDQIRTGCHEASVSGVFLLSHSSKKEDDPFEWLSEHGMEAEDGRIILRRVIKDSGKTSSWIGGVPATKADVADFAKFLVDLHGQHEQQSLMKVSEHRRYLDIYAGLEDEVSAFGSVYTKLVEKRRLLEKLDSDSEEINRRIEMLSFAVEEISSAKIKNGEDEELSSEEAKLSSFEKLYSVVEELSGIFDGNEGSALSLLKRSSSLFSQASDMDKSLSELSSRTESAFYEMEDIHRELKRYESSLVFDPARLEEVQERLELIYNLKKKYLKNVNLPCSELNVFMENARKELEGLGSVSGGKDVLEKEIAVLEKEVYAKAKALSTKRKASASQMSSDIQKILSALGMASSVFKVGITEKEGNSAVQKCSVYGMDDIEFLISANPGLPLMSLSRIASGGELSRVMLALKTVLSEGDTAGTLVFDEIDTGIGGEIALSLGSHMKALASKMQVLCITHLASIAVYADNQIKIQKGVEGEMTSTKVFPVTGQERVKEIARMLSGDSTSASSLEHAASMLSKFGGK